MSDFLRLGTLRATRTYVLLDGCHRVASVEVTLSISEVRTDPATAIWHVPTRLKPALLKTDLVPESRRELELPLCPLLYSDGPDSYLKV